MWGTRLTLLRPRGGFSDTRSTPPLPGRPSHLPALTKSEGILLRVALGKGWSTWTPEPHAGVRGCPGQGRGEVLDPTHLLTTLPKALHKAKSHARSWSTWAMAKGNVRTARCSPQEGHPAHLPPLPPGERGKVDTLGWEIPVWCWFSCLFLLSLVLPAPFLSLSPGTFLSHLGN